MATSIFKTKNTGSQFCECCGRELAKKQLIWSNREGDAGCSERCALAMLEQQNLADEEDSSLEFTDAELLGNHLDECFDTMVPF